MKVKITDIQHFSLHDGEGIRTTVFLKGCSLRCPWCANPECISGKLDDEFGYEISLDDLEKEILKDEGFYKTGGGVTFSGGEPLLQIQELEPSLKSLKDKNVNICFETALFVPENFLKIANKYADEFIVDVKILEKDLCESLLGGNVNQYLSNLELLDLEITTFRIPVCEYTLRKDNVDLILDLLKEFKPKKLEIFKIHNLAKRKYDILGKDFYYKEISDLKIDEFFDELKKVSDNVEIIEI